MKENEKKTLLRSSDDLITAVEQYGSLPNASNRAEAHTHFCKWNMKKACRRI